eukprot:5339834-Pyramimonas_sp.AAC.2
MSPESQQGKPAPNSDESNGMANPLIAMSAPIAVLHFKVLSDNGRCVGTTYRSYVRLTVSSGHTTLLPRSSPHGHLSSHSKILSSVLTSWIP